MIEKLQQALSNKLWQTHLIGNTYTMDGKPDLWKITYYPIFENGKTNEVYEEPRVLVEKSIEGGIDFREVPLRYLSTSITNNKKYGETLKV